VRVIPTSALVAGPCLAVAPWVGDACGWAAQAAFTLRMLHQWAASERAGRSVVPRGFWALSLLGAALDLAYVLHRRDPVFTSSALVTACLFARSAWIARWPRAAGPSGRAVSWPVVAGVLGFAALAVPAIVEGRGALDFGRSIPWLVVGFVGSLGWTARFVVQWWASERRGVAHLPEAFFVVGIVSAVLLTAYAVSQGDPVKTFAFGATTVPYARNVVLLRRARRQEEDALRAERS
jgi:lipid-A-disaccharide synthase-like uncharacterized protein